MVVVTVQFHVHADHANAFRVAVRQHAKNSLTHERSCKRFDVAIDPENEQRFFLYEVYDDAAALAEHQQAAYFNQFATTVEDWIESKQLNVWELVSF